MSVDITMKTVGANNFDNMRQKLRALPGMLDEEVIGSGLIAQARVVVRHAKRSSAFEDRSGLLRSSFRARQTSSRVGRRRIAGTGARAIFGGTTRRGRAYHAHLVEYGHEGGVRRTRSGQRVFVNSAARPHPFIFPAVTQTESQQLLAAQKAMERAMVKLSLNLRNNRLTTRQRQALLA